MMPSRQVFFFFTLAVAFFTTVCGESAEAEVDKSEEPQSNEQRGILDIFSNLRPQQQYRPQTFVNPPLFVPENEMLAPTVQIPSNTQGMSSSNGVRPSLLGGLLGGGQINLGGLLQDGDRNRPPCADLNQDWLRFAFQKCAKIDPRMLTAILPTNTNNLREAKMYYFENSTSNAKTWFDAQEWCTARGMSLVTANDVNENKILQEKLKQIFGGSTPGAIDDPDNPAAFWIGLHDLSGDGRVKWIGDGSSTFVDWHTLTDPVEPDPATLFCGAYSLVGSADNVHMDARDCLADPTLPKLRFICEVSSECSALFMSRYKYSSGHHQNHHHHHEDQAFINFN